jgi:hypothetical protein
VADEDGLAQSERQQEGVDPGRLRRATIVAVRRALGIAERRQIDRETAEAPVAERVEQREETCPRTPSCRR